MYAKNKKPVTLDELDWTQFMALQEDRSEPGPLVKIPCSIHTPYLEREFLLDLIIWNLTSGRMEITQRIVRYVLEHFSPLFETGWTALYYYLCRIMPETAQHTLSDFYREQIDFASPYFSIQLELNSAHLADGIPRYCFIVSTPCDYRRWMVSDDSMRLFMIGSRCCKFDTNNDDMQIRSDDILRLYSNGQPAEDCLPNEYQEMKREGFQFAELFRI